MTMAARRPEGGHVIATDALSVHRGANHVLHDITLDVARGEIITLIGPNGSGKSTLVEALIGAVAPTGGRVRRADGITIGYVPQRLDIDPTLPISVGRFLSLPRRHDRQARETALSQVGLSAEMMGRALAALSGGQFQRVLLARAILGAPDLLILDEATRGLDQPGTAAFYELVADLRARLGCAVLMVSHDLHVVMSASDKVICLNGHICCHGSPEHVASDPEYRALFGEGTAGTLALYRHDHDHAHDGAPDGSGR